MSLSALRQLLDFAGMAQRWFQRCCGLLGYATGGVVTPLLILFCSGASSAFSLDAPVAAGGSAVAVSVDVACMLLFGLQHSAMARPAVKRFVSERLGADLERSCYVLMACASLLLLMLAWRPLPQVLWSLPAWRVWFQVGFVLGTLGVYAAAFALNHAELLGLPQAWFGSGLPGIQPNCLRVSGPYRLVRHPLMTGLLLVFWSTWQMTLGHALFALGMTVYVFVGTHFEEVRLARQFGQAYEEYRARTGMFLPRLLGPRPLREPRPEQHERLTNG